MVYSSSFFRQSGIEGLYNLSVSNPVNLWTCKYAIDRPEFCWFAPVLYFSLIDIEQSMSAGCYVSFGFFVINGVVLYVVLIYYCYLLESK